MSELDINSEDLFFTQDNLYEIDLLEKSLLNKVDTLCDNVYDLEEDLCTESGDENIPPPKNRRRLCIRSDSESECDSVENFVTQNVALMSSSRPQKWREPRGLQPSVIAFTEPTGIKKPYDIELRNADPGAYFSLLVSDEIFEEIADKRSVFMLSTKHSKGFASVHKKGKVIRKPKMVIAYNKAKGSVDMSDQMSAYSSPLRKTIKWYKKLGIELILNTAVVNAWIMFCENTTQQGIVEFRRQLVEYLVDSGKNESISKRPKRLKHTLKAKEGKVRQSRRFCVECYKTSVTTFGSRLAKNKAKKVATYCPECPGLPHYCLQCFNKCHRYL
ncbi:unnamed protein product [Parnassius mnemosyne]|uniref:PiggyBac transposable element-derived protein domain-containing protein n=1 Tax=Parnassius mnemosyne TaxID=213953 RepID=A0AAV1KY49_9NEOP